MTPTPARSAFTVAWVTLVGLFFVGCTALNPTPTVMFVTPHPSFGGDACSLVPYVASIIGSPLPRGTPIAGNVDGISVCSWLLGANPPEGVGINVTVPEKFDAWKARYDGLEPATQVIGLGSEAWFWPVVTQASSNSYLIVRTPSYAIHIGVSVGDHSRDRDVAVAVAQSALERLP